MTDTSNTETPDEHCQGILDQLEDDLGELFAEHAIIADVEDYGRQLGVRFVGENAEEN